MIITIDGPAGTGKTTVARRVAERLGFSYFDTGAMYRAATYRIINEKISLSDEKKLGDFLSRFDFFIKEENHQKHYFIGKEDVTQAIRTEEVTAKVSEVAAHPSIRKSLVQIQRKFGAHGNAVFEGRDMGTVVFPLAELKIFLTARIEVRAQRRDLENKEKWGASSLEKVKNEIEKRDHHDSSRAVSPLEQAHDAHLIDTSDLSIEQVVEKIIALI